MAFTEEERANLTAFLDGELDDEATSAIEAKISVDAEARAEVEQLRQAWSMLDFLPRAQPSPDFTNRTMEKLSLERLPVGSASTSAVRLTPIQPAVPWKTGLFWTAASVLAIGLGYVFTIVLVRSPASPNDPDETIIRHLRVLERWPMYQLVDDLDFLRQLSHPDLFGDEGTGS